MNNKKQYPSLERAVLMEFKQLEHLIYRDYPMSRQPHLSGSTYQIIYFDPKPSKICNLDCNMPSTINYQLR